MDLGVDPHCSRRLLGLPPFKSPPPLGEINRQSRRTTLNTDSHTMGDHVEGIPEPPSPIQVVDGEFTLNYDPSPDLTELSVKLIFSMKTQLRIIRRLMVKSRTFIRGNFNSKWAS